MIGIAIVVAILAPLLAPYDPYANVRVSISDIYSPPVGEHILSVPTTPGRTFSRR